MKMSTILSLWNWGIKALPPSSDLNILVIGREDWDKEHLNGVIEARRGKELRVYSQEMFLAYIAGGNDPLESPRVAEIFGEGHPASEHIREWGFDWPATRLVPALSSPGITTTEEWKEESFLKIMGYNAGTKGRDQSKRRSALHKTFVEELPEIADADYKSKWGSPKSGTRLHRMAERLNLNVMLGIARGNSSEAVGHWLEDLQWLKSEYYDRQHTFQWPSTYVA
jgi:hypothetical protein